MININAALTAGFTLLSISIYVAPVHNQEQVIGYITGALVAGCLIACAVPHNLPTFQSIIIGAAVPIGLFIGSIVGKMLTKRAFRQEMKRKGYFR